jgi:hypothetical protein
MSQGHIRPAYPTNSILRFDLRGFDALAYGRNSITYLCPVISAILRDLRTTGGYQTVPILVLTQLYRLDIRRPYIKPEYVSPAVE